MKTNNNTTPPAPADDFGWFAIGANNAGAYYGFGHETEAQAYAAKLNKKREYDHYSPTFLGETDEEATEAAGCCDITAEGFLLEDAAANEDAEDAEDAEA